MSATIAPATPIDSRHLRVLLAIVDAGGLTRAARTLHLSQSALSHQLKQIESCLGVPLFLRLKRRLVLTDAGRRLLDRARPLVRELDDLGDDFREHARGERGTLRLATECYTCYEWLPPLLQRFRRRHPGVDVGIVAEATDDPVASLVAGEIDLGIVTRTPEVAGVEEHPLFEDELRLVTPPGHPLTRRPFVRPSDLERERLLLYTPPAENFFFREFFSRGTHRPAHVDVIRLTEAVFSMVRADLGVTIAATWAIQPELASGRLAAVRLGARGFRRSWRAVVRQSRIRPTPAYVLEFLDLLRSTVRPARFSRSRPAGRGMRSGAARP
jgi:LysR family transcriptional regulator for metE and metH